MCVCVCERKVGCVFSRGRGRGIASAHHLHTFNTHSPLPTAHTHISNSHQTNQTQKPESDASNVINNNNNRMFFFFLRFLHFVCPGFAQNVFNANHTCESQKAKKQKEGNTNTNTNKRLSDVPRSHTDRHIGACHCENGDHVPA